MNNVLVRALSGIVYVALIVGAILAGWPYFFALACVFGLLGITEYSKLCTPDISFVPLLMDAMATVAIIAIPTVFIAGFSNAGLVVMLTVVAIFVSRLIISLYDLREEPFLDTVKSLAGYLYIGLPLALLNGLYILLPSAKWVVMSMFILIWLNDTGAFCVGSMLGKNKLCERLSPKKSWEGFWGGMVCCIGFGVAAFFIFGLMPIWAWIIFGIIVSIFATFGDLFESQMKRSMHVKDSGHLIPGHGGILDRIDSLLLVAPATFLYIFTLCIL